MNKSPVTVADAERTLLGTDGENRALRSFLMQYGVPCLTVAAMGQHMRRSGWESNYWPDFARQVDNAAGHLTKAGAQIWIRHLLNMETHAAPVGADVAADLEFNAQRLRNVAHLVGLQGAIPEDDATLDGTRGAVLGMIAKRLRGGLGALAAGAPAETVKADLLTLARKAITASDARHADPALAKAAMEQFWSDAQPVTFAPGTIVRKKSGSQWEGAIVGTYSSSITPEGYAVESSTHRGSVQIYPVSALELVKP